MGPNTRPGRSAGPSAPRRSATFLQTTADKGTVIGRWVLWLGFAVWTWSLLTAPMTAPLDSFMHLVNLPFHEAGHIIFSPYMDDARSLQMTLLGGRTSAEVEGHDWEAILSSLGWLHLDHTLAGAARGAGAFLMIGGLACAAAAVLKRDRTPFSPANV